MSEVRPFTRTGTAAAANAPIDVARSVSLAAWLCVFAVVYGALVPFEFAPAPSAGPGHALERIGWSGADPADVLTNILLFIPIGLLLTLHFARGARNWLAPTFTALTCGAAVAILLEIVQTHLPMRVSSAADVLNNALGLGLGAITAPLLHRRTIAWRDALALRVAVCPHHVLWCAALAATVLAALAPFDLIPAPHRITARVVAAQGWPFFGSPPAEPPNAIELLRTVLCQSGWAAALALLCFRAGRERALNRFGAAAFTLRRLVPLFVLLEAAQLLSVHHTFEALDASLAVCGIVAGIGLAATLDARRGLGDSTIFPSLYPRGLFLAVLIGIVLFQMLGLLTPLAGGSAPAPTSPDAGEMARTWQLPFIAVFYRPIHLAVVELALEFARFALVAVAAWFVWSPRDSRFHRITLTGCVVGWSVLLTLGDSLAHVGAVDLTLPAIAAAAAPLSLLAIRNWADLRRRGCELLAAGCSATAAA